MTRNIRVKICGLTAAADVSAALEAGAAYVGFVFFEKSPRNVGLTQARALALSVPPGVAKVALTVDADEATLDALTDQVPLDFLQLHGDESPARVAEVKSRYGLPVIKAIAAADDEERAFWKRTIEKGDQQDGDLEHALALLNKHGALDATRADAQAWTDKAKASMEKLPQSELRDLLVELADFVVSRVY